MRKSVALTLTSLMIFGFAAICEAHFGMIIPDHSAATMTQKKATLEFSFSHPFAGVGMDLVKPKQAGVLFNGQKTDLRDQLTESKVMGTKAWNLDYTFKRPGVYQFFMEPTPYWEPAEDCFIIHYTKVSVPAFGGDEGWDTPVGLKTEIVPLLRPFGNYAGNTFVGQVLTNGKPVPGAEVEVELHNKGRFKLPSEYHETQVIKADAQGIFNFSCPQPGWWGFAALSTADFTIKAPSGPDKGKDKPVELGAVFWTYMTPWN